MNEPIQKLFSCKYEELAPIGRFILFSLRRDIVEFGAFSSRFNGSYVSETETLIVAVENLIDPQSETLAKSLISKRMIDTLGSFSINIDKVEGYLKLSKNDLGITPSAFGITQLRKNINDKNYEAVLKLTTALIAAIEKYKARLAFYGLTNEVVSNLTNALNSLKNDYQQRYEILSNRRLIVQNNLGTLNDLYLRINEIGTIGKIIFKNDSVKLSEYTFSKLLTKVRLVAKDNKEEVNTSGTTD